MISEFLTYLEGLGKGTVIYGSPFDANLRVDRKEGPFIIIYMVQKTELDLRMGRYIPTYSFKMFFADRCPLNSKGEKIQETVDRMMNLAVSVLSSVKDRYNVRQSDFILQTSWGKFDANLAGVTVDFDIKDRPYCLPIEDEDDEDDDQNGEQNSEQNSEQNETQNSEQNG